MPTPAALVVRGPDSLPALVPHLVGFHPEASLVLVGLAPGSHTVVVTVRIDLPPAQLSRAQLAQECASAVVALVRAQALEVVLVVYPPADEDPWSCPEPGPLPRAQLVTAVADELVDAGARPLDALCVVGDRLRSYWCPDPECCPPEGRLAPPSELLRVSATLVAQGSAPLASRAQLLSSLAPRPADDPLRREVTEWLARPMPPSPPPTAARIIGLVDDLLLALGEWDARGRGDLGQVRLVVAAQVICAEIVLRDLTLRALTVEADPALLAAARSVLIEAVRCSDGPAAAAPAAVLAVCAWVSGDGAAARVAVDRSLALDPGYSLAGLVSAALDAGTPPWEWTAMMADLPVEAILATAAGGPPLRGALSRPPLEAMLDGEADPDDVDLRLDFLLDRLGDGELWDASADEPYPYDNPCDPDREQARRDRDADARYLDAETGDDAADDDHDGRPRADRDHAAAGDEPGAPRSSAEAS